VEPLIEMVPTKLGHGNRSALCVNYDECLAVAAAQDLETFSCEACPYRGSRQIPEVTDLTAYGLLLGVIFNLRTID
jgi:hypothetical protein